MTAREVTTAQPAEPPSAARSEGIGNPAAADGEVLSEPTYSVRAVDRVCRILELLQDSPAGVTLTQVVGHTDLPKTSAFRYLWTLEQHNFVVRSHTGTYTLGTGITRMNVPTLDVLVQRSKSWIDELRDELSETVSLGVLEGNEVTYLYIAESSRSVRLAARLGEREPLHATALGKVMAAPLGEQQVRRVLAQAGMAPLTERTIVDVEEYLAELEKVRAQGYAVNDGESDPDGRCVAVLIPGVPIPAGLSVSAPTTRFPFEQVEASARRLRDVAGRIGEEFAAHTHDAAGSRR